MSLREYNLIIEARIAARRSEIQTRRVLQQEMATLGYYAYHAPDKMPDFTKKEAGLERPADKKKNAAQQIEQARAAFMNLYYQNQKGA